MGSSGGSSAPDMGPALSAQRGQNRWMRSVFNQVYSDEAPFRALNLQRARFGADFYPMLRDEIENPELSPGFRRALDTGLEGLRSHYAAAGSPSSGPAQVAGGEFVTGLTDRERQRQQENLFRGAGFQGMPVQSQAPQILGPMQAGTANLSDLLNQKASYDAMAQGGGGFSGGGAFSGAMSGASAGTTFGPWGTLIGGIGGGLFGGFSK